MFLAIFACGALARLHRVPCRHVGGPSVIVWLVFWLPALHHVAAPDIAVFSFHLMAMSLVTTGWHPPPTRWPLLPIAASLWIFLYSACTGVICGQLWWCHIGCAVVDASMSGTWVYKHSVLKCLLAAASWEAFWSLARRWCFDRKVSLFTIAAVPTSPEC